jgi:hypothetical protein
VRAGWRGWRLAAGHEQGHGQRGGAYGKSEDVDEQGAVEHGAKVSLRSGSPGLIREALTATVVAALRRTRARRPPLSSSYTRTFEQIPADTPTAGTGKDKMLVLEPSFDQGNYGCRTFLDFLNRLPHRVAIAGRSGNDITVRLVSSGE